MLHSPSGFPSRISCKIIGCDFSSLDTFTYRLLKAESYKYHVANLYRAGGFRAHAISNQTFPAVLKQGFHLGNVLDDDAAGNCARPHGCQKFVKIIRQCHVGPLIHDAVYRDRQFPMVFPVCHIIKGLEQVTVNHAYQIIKAGIRIRDTTKQRHLFLPDAVKIQFIGTGKIGDLF